MTALFSKRRTNSCGGPLTSTNIRKKFGSQGFRAGAMYRNQEWFDAFDFSYDMSVPNVAHLEPQQGGCCTVMPYFIGKILELPLTTIQDYSLFHILGEYSIDLWKRQIDLILQRNGLISFICHPDYLIESRAQGVYRELLGHLARLRAEKRVWISLPRDVDHWWRSRNQMKLLPQGEGWKIEGSGIPACACRLCEPVGRPPRLYSGRWLLNDPRGSSQGRNRDRARHFRRAKAPGRGRP